MHQLIRKRLQQVAILPVIFTALLAIFSFTPPSPAIFAFSPDRSFEILGDKDKNSNAASGTKPKKPVAKISFSKSKKYVYDSLQLESTGLSRKVFEMALHGMEKLKKSNRLHSDILSIADFSKSSTDKRLFVIDLANDELLFYTWVAHGRNSGGEWARSFSNKPRSKKSSLGFYVTGPAYEGSNGYSLKLLGMEKGFNNNALQRAIVLHGADYVNTDFISSQGYIGRSLGCPAVTTEISGPLINTIKEGSCLFIYHPSASYLQRSVLLN